MSTQHATYLSSPFLLFRLCTEPLLCVQMVFLHINGTVKLAYEFKEIQWPQNYIEDAHCTYNPNSDHGLMDMYHSVFTASLGAPNIVVAMVCYNYLNLQWIATS